MSTFDQYLTRKRHEYGERFDPSDLAVKFRPYFDSDRIKVRMHYGDELTGTIGITTGWKPAFLLMRNSRSIGSSTILTDADEIIAVKRGRVYQNT